MRIPFLKPVAWCLAAVLFVFSIAPRTEAGFVPSAPLVAQAYDRSADLTAIQRVLELKVVQDRLDRLGFSAGEIKARLDGLSDGQVHQLAGHIDDLRVGQDDAIGMLIGLLVIAILVVVLLHLTGHKVIVTK